MNKNKKKQERNLEFEAAMTKIFTGYKISEVEENGDKSWITAEITTPDITDELFELYKNPNLKKAQKNDDRKEILNIINKNLMSVLKDKNLQYSQKKR